MGIFTLCMDFVLLWFFNEWKGYNLVRCKKFDIAEHLLSLMTYLRTGCTKCRIMLYSWLMLHVNYKTPFAAFWENAMQFSDFSPSAAWWCNLSCSHQGCAHCCKQLCDIGLLTSFNLQPPTVFLSIFCPPSDVQKSHCTVSLSPGK